MNGFTICADPSLPTITSQTDSLESRCIGRVFLSVLSVLNARGFAQVCASIIKGIAIFVVCSLSALVAKNNPVHWYGWISPSIKRMSVSVFAGEPIPSRQPFKIFHIDDGVLPLCQRDKSVRFIERLDNRVTLLWLAYAGHESSEKGFVLPAAFYHNRHEVSLARYKKLVTIEVFHGRRFSSAVGGS
jgi:hypothetical protein